MQRIAPVGVVIIITEMGIIRIQTRRIVIIGGSRMVMEGLMMVEVVIMAIEVIV